MFDMRDYANSLLNRMAAAQTTPSIKREPCPYCHALGYTLIAGGEDQGFVEPCAWCAGKGYVVVESIEVTP